MFFLLLCASILRLHVASKFSASAIAPPPNGFLSKLEQELSTTAKGTWAQNENCSGCQCLGLHRCGSLGDLWRKLCGVAYVVFQPHADRRALAKAGVPADAELEFDYRYLYRKGDMVQFWEAVFLPLANGGASLLWHFELKPDHVFLLLTRNGSAMLLQAWYQKFSLAQWMGLSGASDFLCGRGFLGKMKDDEREQIANAAKIFGGGRWFPIIDLENVFVELDRLMFELAAAVEERPSSDADLAKSIQAAQSAIRRTFGANTLSHPQAIRDFRKEGRPEDPHGRHFNPFVVPGRQREWVNERRGSASVPGGIVRVSWQNEAKTLRFGSGTEKRAALLLRYFEDGFRDDTLREAGHDARAGDAFQRVGRMFTG